MNAFDQVKKWRTEEIHTVMAGADGFNRSLNNLYDGVNLPQNPGLGQNNWASPHQDSYCSESVGLHGPTYKKLKLIEQYNPYGFTPTMVCNENNQMIGISFDPAQGQYRLVIFDEECNILSATETSKLVPNTFGGGYFYLNQENNTVVVANNCISCFPTSDVQVRDEVYSIDPLWTSEDIINLVTGSPDNNSLYSALPVWNGDNRNLYWCLIAGQWDYTPPGTLVSNAWIAVVEVIPGADGSCQTVLRDALEMDQQWNNNTFAVDEDGAYFVTNALDSEGKCNLGYLQAVAFDPATNKVTSRYSAPYENSGLLKPGQTNIGSGTTPTLTDTEDGRKLVAITDNAYPQVNVSVYDRNTGAPVTNVPIFAKMRGCDEASLIGVNNRFIVENNFGHTVAYPHSQYVSNEPGMALIDVDAEGDVNDKVQWENNNTCYFAMNMLARESGLIFAHTGDWFSDESSEKGGMYSICAMDSWDGRIIWRITLGRGLQYCHEYGGIYFNRKGDSIYMGTNQYLICIKDSRD